MVETSEKKSVKPKRATGSKETTAPDKKKTAAVKSPAQTTDHAIRKGPRKTADKSLKSNSRPPRTTGKKAAAAKQTRSTTTTKKSTATKSGPSHTSKKQVSTPSGTKRATAKKSSATKKRTSQKTASTATVHISPDNLLIIACIVLFAVFAPLAVKKAISDTGAKLPVGRYEYGIDLSHHNTGEIKWDSLRVMSNTRRQTINKIENAVDIRPVSFVFLKATEGESMKDDRFREFWDNAGTNGIRRGAYHFFRTSKDPIKQAGNFIESVGEITPDDLPPVLDIETIHKGCSKDTLNSRLLRFLHVIERHYGTRPIVYSSEKFIEDHLCDEIRNNYPLWIARYRDRTPDNDSWQYWQFSDKAIVYGMKGKVDMNVRRIR